MVKKNALLFKLKVKKNIKIIKFEDLLELVGEQIKVTLQNDTYVHKVQF